MSEVAVVEQ